MSKPYSKPTKIKVTPRWELFKRSTVWHPLHTDPTDDYRTGPRFWFPTYDLWAIALGIYAIFVGSPLLNSIFPEWMVNIVGIGLIVSAAICLVGVCFPRYNFLELLGKLALVFILGAYAGTVAVFADGTGKNGFVVIVLIMAVWLLGPRISVLFIQVFRNPIVQPFLIKIGLRRKRVTPKLKEELE